MNISKSEFKCVNCGAILNKGIILCPYCKTSYPLKKKKVEAERPPERPGKHPVKQPVERRVKIPPEPLIKPPVEHKVKSLPERPIKRPIKRPTEVPAERSKKVPYSIGKIGEIENSASRNTIFLGILIARIIMGFLIFSDIQLHYLRAVFSSGFLILIPGLLIMLMLKIRKISGWEYLIYTIGLSVAFLIFGGLFVNLVFPLIGIDRPLTLIPLFASFDVFLFVSWIVACRRNKDVSFEIKLPELNLTDKVFSIIPVVFPVLSTLGAITLNNDGSNYLTMIMIGGIVVYFFFLILFRKKLNHNVYPWGILMISIALLLCNSLRSWHLTGGDISLEYYVFQLTKSMSHWSPSQFVDPYNTCLSITILPTVLSNFLNIGGEYIYKVIFPVIFSFSVIGLYLLMKKYMKTVPSLLSIFFFVTQLPFLLWITAIARQEIALYFFILFLLVIFNNDFEPGIKETLFLILGFSLIVSHYSTAYITLFLVTFAFIASFFIRKFIFRWNRHLQKRKKRIAPFKAAGSRYFVPLRLIFLLLLFAFLWYSVFTQTAASLNQILENNINNIKEEYKSSSVRDAFSIDPFSNIYITTEKDVIDYSEYTLATYSDMENIDLYGPDEFEGYDVSPAPTVINPISNDLIYNIMLITQKVITTIFKLSFFIGTIYILIILFMRRIKVELIDIELKIKMKTTDIEVQMIDIEYLSLIIGSIIILFVIILVPFISLEYNFERLYLQTLYILILPALLGMKLILLPFKKIKADMFIILLIIVFYFLYNTGFTTQIVGGEPSEILNNYGTLYAQDYTHDSEVKSIEWLSLNRDKDSLIYVDKASERKLMAYGNIIEGLKRDILPSAIDKKAYVYLGYSNVTDKVILQLFKGKVILYSLPENFLSNNKNLLYNNQYTEIYK